MLLGWERKRRLNLRIRSKWRDDDLFVKVSETLQKSCRVRVSSCLKNASKIAWCPEFLEMSVVEGQWYFGRRNSAASADTKESNTRQYTYICQNIFRILLFCKYEVSSCNFYEKKHKFETRGKMEAAQRKGYLWDFTAYSPFAPFLLTLVRLRLLLPWWWLGRLN